MTEEEKFVMKMLKDSQSTYIEDTKVTQVLLTTEEVKILLNLIEKQQKQIEEYKSGEIFTAKQMHYIEDNYIDKDKIIEKIKILENINESLKFVENRGYEPENYIINSNKYIINFLNKLLEGGDSND